MTSKQRDDFLNGLRRCVQTAPPGQLQNVVRNLHILVSKTGDEATTGKNNSKTILTPKNKSQLFFNYINKIVFDHICSNLYLGANIPFGSDIGTLIALSRDNSVAKVGKNTVAQANSLFHVLDPELHIPAFIKESLDDDIVNNRHGGLHLIADWARRRVHVVDPLMLEVLRSCTFKEVFPLFSEVMESNDAENSEIPSPFNPLFEHIIKNAKDLNNEKRFRNLLALHDVLSKSWRTNASSRFVDGAKSCTGTNIVMNENASEDTFPYGISFTLHSERINSEAFWSARWKSHWTLLHKNGVWTLDGTVAVEYHSGEEGNIQMHGSDSLSIPLNFNGISETIDKWVFGTADDEEEAHGEVGATLWAPFIAPMAAHTTNKVVSHLMDIARMIVKAIETRGEDAIQQRIEQACGPVRSETAVKALRRKMPLNNRLVDFSGASHTQQHQASVRQEQFQ
jgi:hypothetical protein